MAKRKALGKGLGALIADNSNPATERPKPSLREPRTGMNQEVAIDLIDTNLEQPRTLFDEETLRELSESIKELGIIQPVTLSPSGNGRYELISGERRLRASKLAGLTSLPAYIRESSGTTQMLEMALVENIQREDLDPIEISLTYNRLIEECELTQERLSERVGKKRSSISNYLRLLKLPVEIQKAIQSKQVSFGHAKVLVGLKEETAQLSLCMDIIKKQLSVRQTEELAKKQAKPAGATLTKAESIASDYDNLVGNLSKTMGADVNLQLNTKGKGKLVIPIASHEHFEELVAKLDKLIN